MEINQAIMSFSQSEKAKSAIIAASQTMELLAGLSAPEQMGAQRVIRMNLEMILQEIQLAKNVSEDDAWDEIEKTIEKALVMIDSGVAAESVVHLTQALSRITSIGHRSMTVLREKGLL